MRKLLSWMGSSALTLEAPSRQTARARAAAPSGRLDARLRGGLRRRALFGRDGCRHLFGVSRGEDAVDVEQQDEALLQPAHPLQVRDVDAGAEGRRRFDVVRAQLDHLADGVGDESHHRSLAFQLDLDDDDARALRHLARRQTEADGQVHHGNDASAEVDDAADEGRRARDPGDRVVLQDLAHREDGDAVLLAGHGEGEVLGQIGSFFGRDHVDSPGPRRAGNRRRRPPRSRCRASARGRPVRATAGDTQAGFGWGREATGRRCVAACSSDRKNVTSCSRAWACAAISSAVEASSSAADALRWVTWSTRRHGLVDLGHARGLLGRRGRDLLHEVRGLADGRHQVLQHLAGPLGDRDAGRRQGADLLGRRLALLGELAHLGGHDREALAVLAGPGRLDGRVQGQEVRLVGDLLDDRDLLGDGAHGLDGLARRRGRLPPRRWAPFTAICSVCRPFSAFWVIERAHLLEARRRLLDRGGLLARALGQRLRGRRDLGRGAGEGVGPRAHLADHLGQLVDHGHEGLAEAVVVGAGNDPHAQVAVRAGSRPPTTSPSGRRRCR